MNAECSAESTGYVLDTLEVALWVFLHTESFGDAIVPAIKKSRAATQTLSGPLRERLPVQSMAHWQYRNSGSTHSTRWTDCVDTLTDYTNSRWANVEWFLLD